MEGLKWLQELSPACSDLTEMKSLEREILHNYEIHKLRRSSDNGGEMKQAKLGHKHTTEEQQILCIIWEDVWKCFKVSILKTKMLVGD
jgi:hypothetical protein